MHAGQVRLGVADGGLGDGQIGLGFFHAHRALDQGRLGRCDLGLRFSAGGLRGAQFVLRFIHQPAVDALVGRQFHDPRMLRLPALVLAQGTDRAGAGLAEVGLGGGDRFLGRKHGGRGLLHSRPGMDQHGLLLPQLVVQLGNPKVCQRLVLFHAVANIDVQLLDVGRQLDEQRRLLEGLDLPRFDAVDAECLPRGPGGRDADRGRRLLGIGRRQRMTAAETSQRGCCQRYTGNLVRDSVHTSIPSKFNRRVGPGHHVPMVGLRRAGPPYAHSQFGSVL